MNKKLQAKIEKQEEELKKRKEAIAKLTEEAQTNSTEMNRLKKVEADYQKQLDKLTNLQQSTNNRRNMTVDLSSVEIKKTAIEEKMKQTTAELKSLRASLDQYIKENNTEQTEVVEKEISIRQELLKMRQHELDAIESELLNRKTQKIKSDNSSQLQILNLKLEMMESENKDLKIILKEMVKKTSMGFGEVDPKDNLMEVKIKEKQINAKEQEFDLAVEEIMPNFEYE